MNRSNLLIAILIMVSASLVACGKGDFKFDDALGESINTPLGDPTSGLAVYQKNCIFCHGASGGDGFAPDVRGSTAQQIEWIVRNGSGSMPKYSVEQISDQQLLDLIEYLKTL